MVFSDKVLVPDNYTLFNDDIIKVSIISEDTLTDLNVSFHWNCTSFTDRKMVLKLKFDSPNNVSITVSK